MTVPAPEPLTLAEYVKAPPNDQAATRLVAQCVREAAQLVTRRIGAGTARVPAEVRARAELEVAADLYARRATRSGVAGFADNDLNPARLTRDPMEAAEQILAPFLPGGFA